MSEPIEFLDTGDDGSIAFSGSCDGSIAFKGSCDGAIDFLDCDDEVSPSDPPADENGPWRYGQTDLPSGDMDEAFSAGLGTTAEFGSGGGGGGGGAGASASGGQANAGSTIGAGAVVPM